MKMATPPLLAPFMTTAKSAFSKCFHDYSDAVRQREHDRQTAAWVETNITSHATLETSNYLEDVDMPSPELGYLVNDRVQPCANAEGDAKRRGRM